MMSSPPDELCLLMWPSPRKRFLDFVQDILPWTSLLFLLYHNPLTPRSESLWLYTATKNWNQFCDYHLENVKNMTEIVINQLKWQLKTFQHCFVTWYPTETIEIRLILSSRWNEQWQPVKKVTVKKECRSQRGYLQMLVLNNLRSPDTRGKEGEAKWLAGTLKRKWHPSPRRRKKREEMLVVWAGFVGGRTKSQLLRVKKTKEYLRHEGPEFFKSVLKIA